MRFALHFASLVLLALVVGVALSGTVVADASPSEAANATLYVAEENAFEDAQDVESAIENGTLGPDDQMTIDQTLVVELDSERFAADMDDHNGTADEQFFATLDDGATFSLLETNPSPMRGAVTVPIGPDNATVYRNGTTTFVSIEMDAVEPAWLRDADPDPELRDGMALGVRFGYDLDDDEYVALGEPVELYHVEAEMLGPYSLSPPDLVAPELVNVSVKPNVEPDHGIEVRMELADGGTLVEETSEVSWSGFPGVSFDLRDVESGTNYTLDLVHDGDVVQRQNGTVLALDAELRNASVTVTENESAEVRLNLTSDLSHGGQLQILDDSGERIGFEWVPRGTANVSVPLPSGSYDDGEFEPEELRVHAVRRSGSVVDHYPGSGAELTVDVSDLFDTQEGTPTATPTETPTATPTTSPTDTPTATPTSDDEDGSATDVDGPGFTPALVFSVLVALVGVFLVRLARKEGRSS